MVVTLRKTTVRRTDVLGSGSACARGGGCWHKASVFGCLPLVVPIGLSPLLILTLCGPEHVWVVSTEPLDDLSCLTTPGVGRPGDGAVARAVPLTRGIQMHIALQQPKPADMQNSVKAGPRT